MIAAEATVDWTQVLVVGVPMLIAQAAGVIMAILNHHKATLAASKAQNASDKADAADKKAAEVHHQVKPSNGITLTGTVEQMAKDVSAVAKEISEVRREQAVLAAALGEHERDHGYDRRSDADEQNRRRSDRRGT